MIGNTHTQTLQQNFYTYINNLLCYCSLGQVKLTLAESIYAVHYSIEYRVQARVTGQPEVVLKIRHIRSGPQNQAIALACSQRKVTGAGNWARRCFAQQRPILNVDTVA